MTQNLNPNNNIILNNFCYNQINPLQIRYPYPYNKEEKALPRINIKKSSDQKKSVKFNPNISISEVESWKKYNEDMSKETEYMQIKREIANIKLKMELLACKKQKKSNKYEEEGCCTIF